MIHIYASNAFHRRTLRQCVHLIDVLHLLTLKGTLQNWFLLTKQLLAVVTALSM